MPMPKMSVEDWTEIANLIGRYQWLLDEGDAAGWAALFTDDGEVLGVGQEVKGAEALKGAAAATFGGYQGRMRHSLGTLWIEHDQDRDHAIARYYALVTTWNPEPGPELFNLGRCTAELRRVDDAWKIKSNSIGSLRGYAAERAMAGTTAAPNRP